MPSGQKLVLISGLFYQYVAPNGASVKRAYLSFREIEKAK
ncbi:hypothetical protein SAMN06265219_105144 [Gracilimonas mengyeensis]|uniref:Uncharacterized protein n=1 Tax=Gracilimonas mengyeensis TaxID=1302730 RepID=A0A521CGX7_9BACT|nr:hypothetical protein SAMN06265219_105144 [Gracilimonas mengyeensis]